MDRARRHLVLASAGLVLLPDTAGAAARQTRWLLGSPAELLLPPGAPTEASERLWADLARMNARWNAWKPGDLAELNTALRLGRPHRCTPLLAEALRDAARLEAASDGCFNPAIGALVRAWGFHDDVLRPGPRPLAETIARWTRARPTLAALRIDGTQVRSDRRDVQVDLGGYAKGLALDRAFELLGSMGVHDGLLNLGGNLALRGSVDGRPWRIGIQDPHGPGLSATLAVQGPLAVVTSGIYERWRQLDDGQRATHVIDPVTGQPADALASVTVVHRSATVADAAATALLVAGPQRWRRVARRMGVDEVLVIDRQGQRVATPAIAQRLV